MAIGMSLPACIASQEEVEAPLELREESGAPLDEVPEVASFLLTGMGAGLVEDFLLVEGEVSSVSLSRIKSGEIPATVAAKRIPLSVRRTDDEMRLIPGEFLGLAQRYSILALSYGLVAEFGVKHEASPHAVLVGEPWAQANGWVIYCAEDSASWAGSVSKEDVRGGLDEVGGGDACLRLSVGSGDTFHPPQELGGRLVEPRPVGIVSGSLDQGERWPPGAMACGDGEVSLGAGCVKPSGTTVHFRLPPGSHLVEMEVGAAVVSKWVSLVQESSITMGPVVPESEVRVSLWSWPRLFGALEQVISSSLSFTSSGAEAFFVLTEMLADPRGAEPSSEWVEVFNAGEAEGSLLGLSLWDAAGGVPLPDVRLAPGEFGLIVRDDFSFDSDEIPDPEAVAIPVSSLGSNGLKNAGETVQLRGEEGAVLSELFGFPAPEGYTISRYSPWSSPQESCVSEFPGGSPGLANPECEPDLAP